MPKKITFTPRQVQLEGVGFRNLMKKIFKGGQKAWNSFLKPTVDTLAPVIGMAVGAKSSGWTSHNKYFKKHIGW